MLSESIPQSLGNIRGLRILNLSDNNLSGLMPKTLEDLNSLQYFNLCYNKLEREIPNGGCFVNFTPQSLDRNSAPTRKQDKTESPASDTLIGSQWRGVSYIELVRGTGAFSEASLLGRGSFGSAYKGILSYGLIIAAKVFNLQLEKAVKSIGTYSSEL
ncbi:hypothetical protein ACS0TY_027729 [Phlomoides rotata]